MRSGNPVGFVKSRRRFLIVIILLVMVNGILAGLALQ